MTNSKDEGAPLEDVSSTVYPNAPSLTQAPILSTPEYHIYEDSGFQGKNVSGLKIKNPRTKEYIRHTYEIDRIAKEVIAGGWTRVALQFADDMLEDIWAVVDALEIAVGQRGNCIKNHGAVNDESMIKKPSNSLPEMKTGMKLSIIDDGINELAKVNHKNMHEQNIEVHEESPNCHRMAEEENENGTFLRPSSKELRDGGLESDLNKIIDCHATKQSDAKVITIHEPVFKDLGDGGLETDVKNLSVSKPAHSLTENNNKSKKRVKFSVLADTSYGSCCVDEIAAQHDHSQVIVHFGRSCLSPTIRLPVIYVFTVTSLDINAVVQSFENIYNQKDSNVVLMADIMFQTHIESIKKRLEECGYTKVITPEVIHDPASLIPNRKISPELALGEYSLFHISEPPPALLLTLSSRVKDMYIHPTSTTSLPSDTIRATTSSLVRRRYALLNSLNTCSIFGILINTLSVRHHLDALESIQSLITAAGKKHYTFVVGKVNAAKMANFSEVGGWVVIGCWESSLMECKEFYRPVITPWELEWVLTNEEVRVWNGKWRGDFGAIGNSNKKTILEKDDGLKNAEIDGNQFSQGTGNNFNSPQSIDNVSGSDTESEPESEPPKFDLFTGRYVSHSQPLRTSIPGKSRTSLTSLEQSESLKALSRKAKGSLIGIDGEFSPGADFLRHQRTWTGLGSDFQEYPATNLEIEIGRSGVARGYIVDGQKK